ncbi:MAG: RpiB/LacA/LacB family sugar-phosphate isomerase [Eubacteriales bacterium]|nr:RpiB/LacA/LacB family sugar-phosphate isomerase [Eubacteriales bacterium]
MKIVVGSDHAGFELKQKLLPKLRTAYEVLDMGSYDPAPVDFPDIARKVCEAVLSGEAERGVMFCGTGVGASIACNKVSGIRAAVCHDIYSAHQCVEHDNVQIMALGGQIVGWTVAEELINAFMNARFSTEEEFRRRVAKLEQMDEAKAK